LRTTFVYARSYPERRGGGYLEDSGGQNEKEEIPGETQKVMRKVYIPKDLEECFIQVNEQLKHMFLLRSRKSSKRLIENNSSEKRSFQNKL